MVRDCREGGALRAQVLDFAFGSYLRQVHFSSCVQVVPSPASRELPYRGEPFCLPIESIFSFLKNNYRWNDFCFGVSGMPGMIRDCREGGALWAQFLDFAFGSYLRQVHFPHMCRSSPHPTRELPGMSLPSSPISICSIIQPLGHFVTAPQTWGAFTVCMPGIFDIYPMCLLAFSLICANEADD